jgi:hypothetical protein
MQERCTPENPNPSRCSKFVTKWRPVLCFRASRQRKCMACRRAAAWKQRGTAAGAGARPRHQCSVGSASGAAAQSLVRNRVIQSHHPYGCQVTLYAVRCGKGRWALWSVAVSSSSGAGACEGASGGRVRAKRAALPGARTSARAARVAGVGSGRRVTRRAAARGQHRLSAPIKCRPARASRSCGRTGGAAKQERTRQESYGSGPPGGLVPAGPARRQPIPRTRRAGRGSRSCQALAPTLAAAAQRRLHGCRAARAGGLSGACQAARCGGYGITQ